MQQQANGIMGAAPNTRGNSADASLGGMAQAVDTKVEAYRNNPQALEKRLAGNQQLLDLLALQKVKSEKESAANQLLLSEQQNPNTILEQREQEVLAMNKDEMAKQTAGILGQRQKQQQKNMQRTAKGAPQGAPIGAPEQPAMMAARGGLMPLPRPNMQRMAQGGVIGYQSGGQVDKIKAFIAQRGGKLTQQEMKDLVNASKNDPEIISFLTQNQGYISSAEMAEMDKAAGQSAPAGAPIANAGIAAATAKGVGKAPIANAGIAAATAKGVGKAPIANAPSSVPADDVPEGAVVQKEDAPEDFKPLKAIGEGASALGELIKNNPLEALSVGLMFVPGIGWGMAGYRAAKAINYAVKAKKAYDTGKKGIAAVGQAGVRGVKGAVSRPPKLPTRNAKGQITKQGEAGNMFGGTRMASPNRQAAAIGAGYGIAKLGSVLGGEEEVTPQTGLTDAQSATLQGVEKEVDDKPFSMMDNLKPRVEQSYAQKIAAAGNIEAPDRSGISSSIASDAQPQELKDQLNKQLSPDIPAAQKIAMEGSDTNLRRDENRAEFNKGIASREAFAKRQLDPKKLRKERLMANLIGGGQRGLLGVAMGGQQADAQAAKFEDNQLKQISGMRDKKISSDIDVGRIGQTAANQVYASLTSASSAAANTLANTSAANLAAQSAEGDRIYQEHRDKIADRQKAIDAEFQEKKLAILEKGNNAQTLTALLGLRRKQIESTASLVAMLPEMSEGPAIAKRVEDANAKGEKAELSEDDEALYIRYQQITANIEAETKAAQEIEDLIKTLSGFNQASFND